MKDWQITTRRAIDRLKSLPPIDMQMTPELKQVIEAANALRTTAAPGKRTIGE